MRHYQNWKDVKAEDWRWKNFSPREIACKGTGQLLVDETALDNLQRLRDALGVPLIVVSAYRSPEHNRRVGGAKDSYHMKGCAFDINMSNHDPDVFEIAAREVGFRGFGYYAKQGFMHIDMGPTRSWGTRFPRSATRVAAEPPKRESVVESSTMQASAVDLATKAGAGIAAASALDGKVQMIVFAFIGLGVLMTLWIMRERIKAWADGWR